MKKNILFALIVIIFLSSCTRYISTGVGGKCGAWMPKKYSGKAPKQRSNAQMVSF